MLCSHIFQAHAIPDNDISMRGPTEEQGFSCPEHRILEASAAAQDCTEALKFLEGKLGIKIEKFALGVPLGTAQAMAE